MATRNVAAALLRSRRAYFTLKRYAAIRPVAETIAAADREISELEQLQGEAGFLRRLLVGRLIARYRSLRASLTSI